MMPHEDLAQDEGWSVLRADVELHESEVALAVSRVVGLHHVLLCRHTQLKRFTVAITQHIHQIRVPRVVSNILTIHRRKNFRQNVKSVSRGGEQSGTCVQDQFVNLLSERINVQEGVAKPQLLQMHGPIELFCDWDHLDRAFEKAAIHTTKKCGGRLLRVVSEKEGELIATEDFLLHDIVKEGDRSVRCHGRETQSQNTFEG
mmetsp:Transcript_36892/g.88836  ORF Transcript_36892/g.88836 Transcript_36892/m.88836 type:complete len:202 (+) Transcript_36892:220-825(+)